MYLHIGSNKNIREKDIIGIFDIDNSTISHTTRHYLAKAEARGEVSAACEELPERLFFTRKIRKIKFAFLSFLPLLCWGDVRSEVFNSFSRDFSF